MLLQCNNVPLTNERARWCRFSGGFFYSKLIIPWRRTKLELESPRETSHKDIEINLMSQFTSDICIKPNKDIGRRFEHSLLVALLAR